MLNDPHLGTNGSWFTDASGRFVMLRGVNGGGQGKLPPHLPWVERDGFEADRERYLDLLMELGVNSLRLTLFWEAVEPQRGQYDDAYLDRMGAIAQGARARGIHVTLDFHQDIFSRWLGGSGAPAWALENPPATPPPLDNFFWFQRYKGDVKVLDAFERFWTDTDGIQTAYMAMMGHVATRAKDWGAIGFDPMNEPSYGTTGKADLAAFRAQILAPFYERSAAVLHAVEPRWLIFVEPTGLESVEPGVTLPKPAVAGLVFAPHYYNNAVVTAAQVGLTWNGDMTPVRAALDAWTQVGMAWNVPVWLGEWGTIVRFDQARSYVGLHLAEMDARAMHGTYWSAHVEKADGASRWNDEESAIIRPDWTFDPDYADAIARPFPAAVTGKPSVFHHDAENGETVLRYSIPSSTDCRSPRRLTEIRLPQRTHPGTPTVTLRRGTFRIVPDAGGTQRPRALLIDDGPDLPGVPTEQEVRIVR